MSFVIILTFTVFSFLPQNVHFTKKKSAFYKKKKKKKKKNAILCSFLKNVSSSKMVECFVVNNSHFSMIECIAFYALYKSRVLIIPFKVDDFCLFIQLPDAIYKKVAWYFYPILKLIFSLFCGVSLKNITLLYLHGQEYKKIAFSVKKLIFNYKIKCSKNEVEKLPIWRHFLTCGKHRVYIHP